MIVTICVELIMEGAVYNPFDRVPTRGFMDHVTPVLVVPATVVVNCVVCDGLRVVLAGVIVTLINGKS